MQAAAGSDRLGGPRAVLAVRIGPADLGRRVTVRHRVGDGTATLTDVVGVLESWSGPESSVGSAGVLSIRRRNGSLVPVPAAALVAARVVAPEVSAGALQRIAATGWPAPDVVALGDWDLRWAGGGTGRANSVRVDGDPGRPLAAALATVQRWYADRGGTALLQVPLPSVHDAEFERLGWHEVRRVELLQAPVGELAGMAGGTVGITVEPAPSASWLAMVSDRGTTDDALLRTTLTAPRTVGFAAARSPDGALLGIGRVWVEHGWAGVTSVEVAPDARRHGVATAIMAGLARWAADERADRVFLQVFATNAEALALYRRIGFDRHHTYVYRAQGLLNG